MKSQKTWVEIDRGKILYNFNQLKKRVGANVKIGAVLKANAYGHGLPQVAEILKSQTDYFCVDSFNEAIELRKISKKRIIILGYVLEADYQAVIEERFELTVFNKEMLFQLNRIAKKLCKQAFIHLEVETGTARNGVNLNEWNNYLLEVKNCSNLKLVGVFTHYANIEDTTNHPYAKKQMLLYQKAIEKVNKMAFTNFEKHTACSAAAILFPETHLDFIRLGISLYGMWSSKETNLSAINKNIKINLKPALTWKTCVAHIKLLPQGAYVGYGCTEKLMRDSILAVIPVGYYDGFDRGLSSIGEVLIRGVRCRVIGRVCMNMTIIDITNVKKTQVGDEVVLIGVQKNEEVTPESIAAKINTINYEITTRINPLIERIIV